MAIAFCRPSSLNNGMIQGKLRLLWSKVLEVSCARFSAPVATMHLKKSVTSSWDAGASKERMWPPAMQPLIAWGIFLATIRIISQGSSFRSRTNFFRKTATTGTSTAANPARSMDCATASIMPVRMPRAHRLCEPSRNVVSMKRTSMPVSSCSPNPRPVYNRGEPDLRRPLKRRKP